MKMNNTKTKDLWETVKAVLKEEFIAMNDYLKNQDKSQKQSNFMISAWCQEKKKGAIRQGCPAKPLTIEGGAWWIFPSLGGECHCLVGVIYRGRPPTPFQSAWNYGPANLNKRRAETSLFTFLWIHLDDCAVATYIPKRVVLIKRRMGSRHSLGLV